MIKKLLSFSHQTVTIKIKFGHQRNAMNFLGQYRYWRVKRWRRWKVFIGRRGGVRWRGWWAGTNNSGRSQSPQTTLNNWTLSSKKLKLHSRIFKSSRATKWLSRLSFIGCFLIILRYHFRELVHLRFWHSQPIVVRSLKLSPLFTKILF